MKILKFRARADATESSDNSPARFDLFDRTGQFDDFREVIAGPVTLEPHDDRTDMCVSVPVRLVISSTAGPAIEIGPFTLDSRDIVTLYNALAAHINTFTGEFKVRKS